MKQPFYSRVSGARVEIPSPEDRHKARLARMRHIIWLAAKTMTEVGKVDACRVVMYTLTYEGIDDWAPRHISDFVRWLRTNGTQGYAWVAELQRRGAVHYHIMSLMPVGLSWTKPSEQNGGWARGWTWVTDNVRHPLYIMKYLQKDEGKDGSRKFPRGLRLYAVSQSVVRRMSFENAVSYRECQLPRWHWEDACDDELIRCSFRCPGGISTGRFKAISPYARGALESIDTLSGEKYYRFMTLRSEA